MTICSTPLLYCWCGSGLGDSCPRWQLSHVAVIWVAVVLSWVAVVLGVFLVESITTSLSALCIACKRFTLVVLGGSYPMLQFYPKWELSWVGVA